MTRSTGQQGDSAHDSDRILGSDVVDRAPRKPGSPRAFVFRARHRLSRDLDYAAVRSARLRTGAGPLTVFVRPSGRGGHRLGLGVSRKVGIAATRVRIKRLLREAFRLSYGELPDPGDGPARGYDVLISVRPHEPLTLAAYRTLLVKAMTWLDRTHRGRVDRGGGPAAGDDRSGA